MPDQATLTPFVSAIIPSYNPDKGKLLMAVQSLFDQTYPHLEVIICDDGSEFDVDNELRPLLPVLRNPANMTVEIIRNDQNLGISAARNKAIGVAKGKWLIWLDDDDQLGADCLQILISKSDSRKMLIGECVVDENRLISTRRPKSYWQDAKMYFRTERDPFLLNIISLQPQLILKEAFDHIGGFDENYRYAELTELFLRFLLAYGLEEVEFVDRATYYYNRNKPGSLTKHRAELMAFRKKALLSYMCGINVKADDISYVGRNEKTGMQMYKLLKS